MYKNKNNRMLLLAIYKFQKSFIPRKFLLRFSFFVHPVRPRSPTGLWDTLSSKLHRKSNIHEKVKIWAYQKRSIHRLGLPLAANKTIERGPKP